MVTIIPHIKLYHFGFDAEENNNTDAHEVVLCFEHKLKVWCRAKMSGYYSINAVPEFGHVSVWIEYKEDADLFREKWTQDDEDELSTT